MVGRTPDSTSVSRCGFILEGRHRSLEGLRSGTQQVVGAHSPGENGRGIGIDTIELKPEGPQPGDFAAALDATKRQPEQRPQRIAEVIRLLEAGQKERPKV